MYIHNVYIYIYISLHIYLLYMSYTVRMLWYLTIDIHYIYIYTHAINMFRIPPEPWAMKNTQPISYQLVYRFLYYGLASIG